MKSILVAVSDIVPGDAVLTKTFDVGREYLRIVVATERVNINRNVILTILGPDGIRRLGWPAETALRVVR